MTTPYIPGQDYVGSKVNAVPEIFTQDSFFQRTPHAGGLTPTVALWSTNAGTAAASVTTVTGFDQAGHFTVTAGSAPSAGTVCTLVFGRPLTATPSSVLVNSADTTAGATTNPTFGVLAVSKTGFAVYGPALTATHTYLMNYQVIQ